MAVFHLSLVAEDDVSDILTYGLFQFGEAAAFDYHDALTAHFSYIAENPLHHMKVDHISQGSRRSIFRAHSIYYRITNGKIIIERVLGRQAI